MVELIIAPVSVALGILTDRIMAELQRLRRRRQDPPVDSMKPQAVGGLVAPARSDVWRRRILQQRWVQPQLGILPAYVVLTHQLDRTVAQLADVHGCRRPYTAREILSWSAIDAAELQTRQATVGWSMDTPN